jgi:hypothetical protein
MPGLGYLWELRATVRSQDDAKNLRYCRIRLPAGSFGNPEHWGSVTELYEANQSGIVLRQIQLFDKAYLFVHRFSQDHPEIRNLLGQTFGGGLRIAPLTSEDLELGRIRHEEFEHAWLTGHVGERPLEEFRDELLIVAVDEGPQRLWEAWATAEHWYPYMGAAATLNVTERAIEALIDVKSIRLMGLDDPAAASPLPETSYPLVLIDRRSWSSQTVGYEITEGGVRDLQDRRRIRTAPITATDPKSSSPNS